MNTETAEVKSKGTIVGTAEYSVFDTVDEAVNEQGESSVLELINTQAKTTAMNQVRQDNTSSGKLTKKNLESFFTSGKAAPEQFAQMGEALTADLADGGTRAAELYREVMG